MDNSINCINGIKRALFISLSIALFVSGVLVSNQQSTAASKPSLSKSASVMVGKSKTILIKTKGLKLKSISVKSSDTTIFTTKANKKMKTITIKGKVAGEATLKTIIKTKSKIFKFSTKVTVIPSDAKDPNPDVITDGNGMSVKINNSKSLTFFFKKTTVDFSKLIRLKITTTDTLSSIPISYDDAVIIDGGKTVTVNLSSLPLITDSEYKATYEMDGEDPLSVVFTFRRSTPNLSFKDGSKKTLSKIKLNTGKNIGTFNLKNDYDLPVSYTLSGQDSTQFDISDKGVLSWKIEAEKPGKRKKLSVTITATTPVTDIYNTSSTSIDLTIKLK